MRQRVVTGGQLLSCVFLAWLLLPLAAVEPRDREPTAALLRRVISTDISDGARNDGRSGMNDRRYDSDTPLHADDLQSVSLNAEGSFSFVRKSMEGSNSAVVVAARRSTSGASPVVRDVPSVGASAVEATSGGATSFASPSSGRDSVLQREETASSVRDSTELLGSSRSCRQLSDDLLKWAKQRGIHGVDNLEISEFPRGPGGRLVRSLTPRKFVAKGEVVLSVPASLIIYSGAEHTLAVLRKTFQERGFPPASLDSPSHQLRLAAALLALHAVKGDVWGGYIDNLPSPAELRQSHPTLASPGLLWAFRELPVVERIKRQQSRRARDYDSFKSMGGRVSADDWEWAEVVISSRSWAGPHGSAEGIMLVPVADFVGSGLEADQNLRTRQGDPNKSEPFEFVATRDIAAGTELVDYFAAASDELWVQTWGTLLPGNAQMFKVPPLDQKACSRLSETVWPALTSADRSCLAPEAEPQKEAFCTLARLSTEHCQDFKPFPCKDRLCFAGSGLLVDFQRMNAQRPWLFRVLVVLGCMLLVVRGHNLLLLKPLRFPPPPRPRPHRVRLSTPPGHGSRQAPGVNCDSEVVHKQQIVKADSGLGFRGAIAEQATRATSLPVSGRPCSR